MDVGGQRAPCPHAELFNGPGRAWLGRQILLDDERAAIERHLRELDRLGEDLAVLDHAVAEATIDDSSVRRLLTITGVNVTVAAGLVAAVGDIGRFSSPQKLVHRLRQKIHIVRRLCQGRGMAHEVSVIVGDDDRARLEVIVKDRNQRRKHVQRWRRWPGGRA